MEYVYCNLAILL